MNGYQRHGRVGEGVDWVCIPFQFLLALAERGAILERYNLDTDNYLSKRLVPNALLVAVRTRQQRVADIRAAKRKEEERIKRPLLRYLPTT